MAYVDPRLPELGVRLMTARHNAPHLRSLYPEGTLEDYTALRMGLGISEGLSEMIPEKSVILEHGLHNLHAISPDKGCYLGQELIARVLHRGQLHKHTFPVQCFGEPPEIGAELRYDGQTVGTLLSRQGEIGIGLLRISAAQHAESTATPLTTTSGTTRLLPYSLPWMALEAPSAGPESQ